MTERALVTAHLTEPVTPGRNHRSDFRLDIYQHIPGSVLRGAIAADWIRYHGDSITAEREFIDVFDGSGSFGPLHTEGSLPVPLSVFLHKYEPTDDCDKLWWDAARGDTTKVCPACGQRLEQSKGQQQGSPDVVTRTLVELTPEGVARDGRLFRQPSLAEGTTLRGWLHGSAVRSLQLGDEPIDELSLGSRRSVRGSVEISFDLAATPDPVEVIGDDVILRLASPGIFVDSFGLPKSKPSCIELSEVLDTEVRDVKGWSRWDEHGGWHAASGLPKPSERCVAAGSTYLVKCAEQPSEEKLRTLMTRGIGLRRREGFGGLYRINTSNQEAR